LRDAPPDDVTIAWLLGSLHKRSFGLVMLLIALVGLVPGVSVFTVLRAKKRGPSPIISRETLAEMVGTTRSRVSFFMNKFRPLRFVDYNGGGMEVHSSLLNVVLHD
jgi:hypothetical protein